MASVDVGDNKDQTSDEKKESTTALLAMMLGNYVGLQGPILLPLWLGAAITVFGLGDGTGGWLATTELGAMAAASLFISTKMDKLDRRTVAWIGIGLIIGGNALSVVAMNDLALTNLFLFRGVTGIGEGLLVAAVNAAAAGTKNPQRSFAFMSAAFVGVAAVAFAIAPLAIEKYSPIAVFWLMALFAVVCALLIIALPRFAKVAAQSDDSATSPFNRSAFMMLLGFAAANACFMGVWTFVGQIGTGTVGMDLNAVGQVLGISTLLGILGPIIANMLGLRFGRSLPVIGAFALYWLALIAFSYLHGVFTYTAAVFSFSVIIMFFVTFMMTRFGELDPSGRVAAAGPAFQSLGNAVGPALAGTVVGLAGGWSGLALSGSILLILAGGLIISAIRSNVRALSFVS